MYAIRSYYDIILMDIEMKFLNGMEAAEQIRAVDKDVVIIFITNMPQYAIKGYARITSYNVCYTKLLRKNLPGHKNFSLCAHHLDSMV